MTPVGHEATPRQGQEGRARWKWARWRWVVVAFCAALGLLAVAQIGPIPDRGSNPQALSVDELAGMVADLSRETAALQAEAADIAVRLAERQSQFGSEAILTSREESDLEALEVMVGLREGRGSGIVLEISDPSGALTPFDFEQLVGELRSSGAEAIVLNGTRLEFNAHFGGGSSPPTVNGRALQQPYVVQAIGAPDALALSLELPGGLLSRLRALPGVRSPLYVEDVIVVPPRSRVGTMFEYATRAGE